MPANPDIPAAAWRRRLDQELEAPGRPLRPSFLEIVQLIPLTMRLRRYVNRLRQSGREPNTDFLNMLDPGPYMGVPLGGLGGGTITRGWQGDFVRWQMRPGTYTYGSVPADQFSVFIQRGDERPTAHVLFPGQPDTGSLGGWAWDMPAEKATYHALFPRAWTVYEKLAPGIRLTCRQVSPVIPHNYQESSTPAGVFVWTVENSGDQAATVGLMLTFQNGTGAENDRAGGHSNHAFLLEAGEPGETGRHVQGVALRHTYRQPRPAAPAEDGFEDPLTFAIAAQARDGVEVTHRARFATNGSGMDVWGDFAEDGRLENVDDPRPSAERSSIGAAVCATVEVPPGESREVAFALAWDMPRARFGEGRAWWRRYTRFYGREGDAAPTIARDALAHYPDWEAQIDAWQEPILEDERLPDWYKCALFNETYVLVDGGTIWTDGLAETPDGLPTDPPLGEPGDLGHFAYLEGHEYRMYNTYDVHFYASFALARLWPELELSLQRDFARALRVDDPTETRILVSNTVAPRKARGAIPHDLGGPTEDPWYAVNIYNYQDVSRWKDLNPKFVLQVYRDFVATQDIDFLAEMWEPVVEALEYMQRFDVDGDGLIENEGYPDQTYDTWTVKGPSAYSGGLWLAALAAAAEIARLLDDPDAARAYCDQFERAQQAYESLLWTGEYYAYDASGSRQQNSVMADQLAGDWYARACGLPGIVPTEHARSALRKVFDLNVMAFADGEMGAVNGMRPDGQIDTTSLQSSEVWAGVTYGVAASMLQLGLREEAFTTAQGAYRQTYEVLGYWFLTPEAWTIKGEHRSLAYMRPLAVWAMQWAWERGIGDGEEGEPG